MIKNYKRKTYLICILLVFTLLLSQTMKAFASSEEESEKSAGIGDSEDIIYLEEEGVSYDIDLTNEELDAVINSIGDPERRDLMDKYFYLPSVESVRIQNIDSLDVIKQAKILSEMPIEELRAAAKKIEDNINFSINLQNNRNEMQNVLLTNDIETSIQRAAGTHRYTLSHSYEGSAGTIAKIESLVTWTVNANNIVVGLAPSTTTSINSSHYEWIGEIGGTQYLSGGKGYVHKYRNFKPKSNSTTFQIWCKGTFGSSSRPVESGGVI